jgi:HD-like signal output (HDOD) protein
MKELKYIEKIRSEYSLLSLPQSLSQILSMVGSDDFSMEDLSTAVSKDPGLTSRILTMANSAFYRHQAQISTVQQAVIMLGMMQVKCLALSTSVFVIENYKDKINLDIKALFSHFISVALGSRMLGEAIGFDLTEEAFIAGLLHDIGIVFFIHHFPEDYRTVIDNLNDYGRLTEAEDDILGVNHAAIGRMLAEKWNLPTALCEAIGNHHKIPDKIGEVSIVNIVQLSELLSKSAIDNRPKHLEERLETVGRLSKLMIMDRQKIDDISFSLLNETIKMAEYIGVDIGDPTDVLTRANRELFNSYMTIENLFRERKELSRRILAEERRTAAMETKNVAMATLSHYLNNATMAISGRTQLIKMMVNNGAIRDAKSELDPVLEVIEQSVKKILAVLCELRDMTSLEDMEKYSESKAINIDDRIMERMKQMEKTADQIIVLPDTE